MSEGKRDLFDVLGIGTYEHSYTELMATLFEERQGWARDFFREVFGRLPSQGTMQTKTQLSIPHKDGKRTRDRLDLVLAFGNAEPDIWVIEAKIKSAESSDQLQRYESPEAQQKIADEFGLEKPLQDKWHYSYLTLEGEEPTPYLTLEGEEPTRPSRFGAVKYERLHKVFAQSTPDLSEEIRPAYRCLHDRLDDYYRARREILNGDTPLEGTRLKDYLNDTSGLIDERNKFHWLMKRNAEDLGGPPGGPQLECGIAQSQGSAKPNCRTVNPDWQGKKYGESGADLRDCFDIHFELQLTSGDNVAFVLHYETNPYKPQLSKDPNIGKEDLEEYRKRREKFAQCLRHHNEELKAAGWRLTKYELQLAKRPKNFGLNETVGDFRRWVSEGTETMTQAVERAGRDSGLWR